MEHVAFVALAKEAENSGKGDVNKLKAHLTEVASGE
jgi:hypothetical protein